jgi:hypothetical protein
VCAARLVTVKKNAPISDKLNMPKNRLTIFPFTANAMQNISLASLIGEL